MATRVRTCRGGTGLSVQGCRTFRGGTDLSVQGCRVRWGLAGAMATAGRWVAGADSGQLRAGAGSGRLRAGAGSGRLRRLPFLAALLHTAMAAPDTWDQVQTVLMGIGSGEAAAGQALRAAKLLDPADSSLAGLAHLATVKDAANAERALHRWVDRQAWRRLLPEIYHFVTPKYRVDYTVEEGCHAAATEAATAASTRSSSSSNEQSGKDKRTP